VTRDILLVTSGVFHPPYSGRLALQEALGQLDGFVFRHVSSLEKLPADLKKFSAMVLYYHRKTISDAALTRLEGFVSGGGGVLALHSATASFKDSQRYSEIMGGQFTGHGPVENFEVQSRRYDIFRGIEPFTIRDELYIHELGPGIDVHFTAMHGSGETPVVWTHLYGQGKVCYVEPGHTTASLKHPAVQEILRRGLKWVCGAE
jgi:type 1 glutamine amidotransferase